MDSRHYVEQKRQLHQPAGWLVGAFRLSQNSAVIVKTFLGFELCNVLNLWSAEAGAPVLKILAHPMWVCLKQFNGESRFKFLLFVFGFLTPQLLRGPEMQQEPWMNQLVVTLHWWHQYIEQLRLETSSDIDV